MQYADTLFDFGMCWSLLVGSREDNVAGLLCIPSSNADAERGFSILRKIHTDERASLSHFSLVSLMSLKFNNTSCCFDTDFSDELLTQQCKKAQRYKGRSHGDYSHFDYLSIS